jgi:DNA-binding NtrC family response regulator
VLVIDDEESIRYSLAKGLRREGFVVETAATGREGVDRFASGGFDAVLTDVRLPDLSGLDIVALCTEVDPAVPVVVMTGYGSVDGALETMRRGGRDYVQKPFQLSDVVATLRRAMAERQGEREARRLRARVERRFSPTGYAQVESELKRLPATPEEAAAEAEGMPAAGAGPLALRDAQRKFEVRYVEDLLSRTGGNVAAAARLASISRPNFHKKLKALGVDPARFKRAHRRGKSAGS